MLAELHVQLYAATIARSQHRVRTDLNSLTSLGTADSTASGMEVVSTAVTVNADMTTSPNASHVAFRALLLDFIVNIQQL